MRIALVAISVLSLGGCAVNLWPHRVHSLPAVHGVVTRSGVPVSGLRVHVYPNFRDGDCKPSRHFGVTDSKGNFAIQGDRDIQWFLAIAADRKAYWGVCIEGAAGFTQGIKAFHIGDPPADVRISCDLDADPNNPPGIGICHQQ